ncbi:MAG: hypothetical protein ACYTEZ_12440 [Planctomycetota bacterium]|jgi:hypothetical protein
MRVEAEPVLSVRTGPRPDPIPHASASLWTLHSPWVGALIAFGAATLWLAPRDLGMMACGAGLMAILVSAARARLRMTCHAAHLSGGVIALTVLRSPEEAGSFVLAAGTVVVAVLVARAWALQVRTEVAPLAGRLPWRFRTSFRGLTLRFGIAGLAVGIAFALFGTDPHLRIVGVAMLPLALRSYVGNLLSRRATRAIWCIALAAHVTILACFVPGYGAAAAAWAVVVGETLLFAGEALVVARRTGVTPMPLLQLASFACAALIVLLLTIPNSADWMLLAGIALGIATGAFFLPRARTERARRPRNRRGG